MRCSLLGVVHSLAVPCISGHLLPHYKSYLQTLIHTSINGCMFQKKINVMQQSTFFLEESWVSL